MWKAEVANYKKILSKLKLANLLVFSGINLILSDNYGYTPSFAAEDLKASDGDVIVNISGKIMKPLERIFRK